MNDNHFADGTSAWGDAALARALVYRSALDGSAFTRAVHATARGRRLRRVGVMGGAAALAAISALVLRPDHFQLPPVFNSLLRETVQVADSVPIGPMMAVLAIVTLCLGASRAMDSI